MDYKGEDIVEGKFEYRNMDDAKQVKSLQADFFVLQIYTHQFYAVVDIILHNIVVASVFQLNGVHKFLLEQWDHRRSQRGQRGNTGGNRSVPSPSHPDCPLLKFPVF
jgi:hypothetical protein